MADENKNTQTANVERIENVDPIINIDDDLKQAIKSAIKTALIYIGAYTIGTLIGDAIVIRQGLAQTRMINNRSKFIEIATKQLEEDGIKIDANVREALERELQIVPLENTFSGTAYNYRNNALRNNALKNNRFHR